MDDEPTLQVNFYPKIYYSTNFWPQKLFYDDVQSLDEDVPEVAVQEIRKFSKQGSEEMAFDKYLDLMEIF